jgi:hypothetical protein
MTGWLNWCDRGITALALVIVGALAPPALAEVRLPPGFVKEVYVSGSGFATGRGSRGFPSTSTLVFDRSGSLYLARTGARYQNTDSSSS